MPFKFPVKSSPDAQKSISIYKTHSTNLPLCSSLVWIDSPIDQPASYINIDGHQNIFRVHNFAWAYCISGGVAQLNYESTL